MYLAIALGNTNLRLALVQDGNISESRCLPLSEEPVHAVTFAHFREVENVLIASVHPNLLGRLEEALESLELSRQVAGRDFPIPLVNRYRQPQEAGLDRLLGVLAAGAQYPGEAVAVVDFGTALTVNLGSPEGEFLGGYIGIGASSGAAALAQRAPRLPRLELTAPEKKIPADTSRALNDGIVWQMAGGVERLLKEMRDLLPWPFRVVVTGGDGPLIASSIPGIDRVEPNLVLQGLWIAYERSL